MDLSACTILPLLVFYLEARGHTESIFEEEADELRDPTRV